MGVIRALQEEIGIVEAAVVQLHKEQLERADSLASDVDQVQTLISPHVQDHKHFACCYAQQCLLYA